MSDEIVNRVSKSKLITVDLEDFYLEGKRIVIDIAPWLYEGIILKEKDFRAYIKTHNWSQYQNNFIALTCTTEAIIPSWAYLLITASLTPYAKKVIVGDLNLLESTIFIEIINAFDISQYRDKSIIIKGCSNKPIPNTAFTALVQKLQPVAKSIMYGEACSTVPICKNNK